jgi:hypothetical protein
LVFALFFERGEGTRMKPYVISPATSILPLLWMSRFKGLGDPPGPVSTALGGGQHT